MGSDIERRAGLDLEITRVDPLLWNGHVAMFQLCSDADYIGNWKLNTGNSVSFISIQPHYIRILSKSARVTVVEEFRDGRTDDKDFFSCRARFYEEGVPETVYKGEVSVRNMVECKLQDDQRVQIGIQRLKQLKDLIAPRVRVRAAA